MQSLSLVLNVSCLRYIFRSGTNDHTAQCLTHGNAFLRLYVNDYICNRSCLGTCFSRLVPLIAQKQYISPREVALNLFSLANLVPKLSQDIRLGKGSHRTRTTLRHSFHLLLAASWEVCNVPLKLLRQVLSCSLWVPLARSFLYTCYFNKIYTKLWAIEIVFGPGVKSSILETTNPAAPLTISYHLVGLSGIFKTR